MPTPDVTNHPGLNRELKMLVSNTLKVLEFFVPILKRENKLL